MPDLKTATEQLLKPTATIHVGNKLSLIERRVFNAVIWHSQKQRFGNKSDTLAVSLLMSLVGLERSKNMDVIKDALEKLTTTPIVWNTLRKDRTADWGICTFLAGAELSGGKLRYVLNPLLAEKVNHPTLFAKIQLLVQTQFTSKYSLALYEFLLDELGRAKKLEAHEVEVALDTLRHILQFDGAYKHLNSDVLKPCVREINKHADISVNYRGAKKGRAVVAVIFTVERSAVQIPMPLLDTNVPTEAPAPELDDARLRTLVDKGVSRRKAKGLVETHDADRVDGNIAYAEREYAAGKVKNLSAYLVRAIEEDYRPRQTPEELRREEVAERRRQSERQRAALETLKEEWRMFRGRRVRERFAALSEQEQERCRAQFAERLAASNAVLHARFRKEGFSSAMVEAQFYGGLCDELLTEPDETSFETYCLEHGNPP